MSLNLDRSTWQQVRLGDVARHVNDRVDVEASGLSRFLAGGHIPSGSLRIRAWGEIGRDPMGPMFYKRFAPGQVLYVSRRTYLRKVAVPHFAGITGEKTFVLETSNPSILLQDFLPFILSNERFHNYAISNSRGSVNPYLNWGELAAYEFALPPLDDQQRIAELLWSVERHRDSAITTASAHVSAKMVLVQRRLEGGVEELGWTKQPVSALVTSGPTNGKSARATAEDEGTPTLSISAVRNGGVRGGDSVKWVDVDPQSVKAFELQQDDFLVVRGNGNRSLTGRGGLVCNSLPPGCIYPDLLIRLRFDDRRILPKFAAEQWNSEYAHAALICNAKSTNGIWKINGKDIKSHQLVVPPVSAQHELLDQLATLDDARDAADAESQYLGSLKLSLLDQIFGGS